MKDKYRDDLVQVIKDIGQEIIDRAESMVGPDVDMITEFSVYADIPQPMDGPPTLGWSTKVLVKNFYDRLNGEFHGEMKLTLESDTITIERSK